MRLKVHMRRTANIFPRVMFWWKHPSAREYSRGQVTEASSNKRILVVVSRTRLSLSQITVKALYDYIIFTGVFMTRADILVIFLLSAKTPKHFLFGHQLLPN